jgi:very-short-patch-repair endonuclease
MANVEVARRLRRDQTPAERRFWTLVRTLREQGWHFRRQATIGNYVVDFACKSAGLVFEIDGDTHYVADAAQKDAVRTAYLQGRGYRVVRFTNADVVDNPDGVYLVVEGLLRGSVES